MRGISKGAKPGVERVLKVYGNKAELYLGMRTFTHSETMETLDDIGIPTTRKIYHLS